jgi:hypothetical protein
VTDSAASGSPLELLQQSRLGIDAVPADQLREGADDGAARSLFALRVARRMVSSNCRERTPFAAPGCRSLRMRAGGKIEHRAHEIDAREQGLHGLDEARIDVDDEGPSSVTMTSSDSAPCQSEWLGEPPQRLRLG